MREIVEAGAGCGKTTRLVSRYLEALGLDLDTHKLKPGGARVREIICVTFTEEAAHEMQGRILRKLKELGQQELVQEVMAQAKISTFHSLCKSLIDPHLTSLGYLDTALYQPVLANRYRREFLKLELASYPKLDQLLEHLEIHELLDLLTRLWFRKPGDAGEVAKNYANFKATFDTQRDSLLRQIEQIRAHPDASEIPWLEGLEVYLRDPNEAPFKFKNLSKKAKELLAKFPDLRPQAEAYRAFCEDYLICALGDEHQLKESNFYQNLQEFIEGCQSRRPKILDFDALEYECEALLAQLEQKGARALTPPKVLLVDEFQDTNRHQFSILEKISDAETKWFYVGDPKQSIYAFRGAEVSLFLEKKQTLELSTLSTNYRSSPTLVEFVNLVQAQLFQSRVNPHHPEAQELSAHRKAQEGTAITLRRYAEFNRQDIHQNLLEDLSKASLGSRAVLFRSWKALYLFSNELKTRELPYSILGAEAYLDHFLTKLFCDFLLYQVFPGQAFYSFSLKKWLPTPAAQSELRVPGQDWRGYLEAFCHLFAPERFSLGSEWAAAMSLLIRDLMAQGLPHRFDLENFAFFLRNNATQFEVELPRNPAPAGEITLATIHKSKGLEFDSVFLPDLYVRPQTQSSTETFQLRFHTVQGQKYSSLWYKNLQRAEKERLEAEKSRLFYVALTRAKTALYLYSPLAKDKSPKADGLSFLGWSNSEAQYWNQCLESLRLLPQFQSWLGENQISEQFHDNKRPSTAAKAGPTRWASLGQTTHSLIQNDVFYRMGVRNFLENQGRHQKITQVFRRAGALEGLNEALEKGKFVHQILELWNGDLQSLAGLGVEESHAFYSLFVQLRSLPSLRDYWNCLSLRPEQLRRELPIQIRAPHHALSGVVDALYWQGRHLTLIDWKTSTHIGSFQRQDRVQAIRNQLDVYAEFFVPKFDSIDGLAIGIDVASSEGDKVWEIFKENLYRREVGTTADITPG